MTSISADPWPRPPAYVDRWGTPEAEWGPNLASLETLPWPPRPSSAGSPARLVVVAPHPDDEALGTGGLIVRCLADSWAVHVVALSDGEAAHGRGSRRLARRRRREQRSCLERLVAGGPGALTTVRLQLPDGAIAAHERELEANLVALLRAGDWCLTTCQWDGHPDHEAAGRAGVAAARTAGAAVAEYPIWAWHWAAPSSFPWHRARRIDLTEREQQVKAGAVDEHRSQLVPTRRHASPVVPPHVLARFRRPCEVVFP